MRGKYIVPIQRFRAAYQRLGWLEEISKSSKYIIWTDPMNSSIWIRLPLDENSIEYSLYQDKNVMMLLYALNQPETDDSSVEMLSQLKEYNYKLINRIVGKRDKINNTIPFELSNVVTEKNIESFRHFYLTKSKNKKQIPIEKFELNHTEVGSFVIPVSISVEEEKNESIIPLQTDISRVLHKYLDAIEVLKWIPRSSAIDFADRVISESIDSKIVKDFFGNDRSIARFTEKYSNEVSTVTIGSKGSFLLDYGLPIEQKTFKEVDLSGVGMLSEEIISTLEEREIAADDTKVELKETAFDVIVERLDRSGKVRFTVTGIGGEELKKPFKAFSNEQPQSKLDVFADLFKNTGATTITGDISKSKGKVGTIFIDNIGDKKTTQKNLELFEDKF